MDLISRQAAIDALDVLCQEHRYRIPGKRETYSQYNEAWQDALDRAEGAIGNLPSAQPEIKCIAKVTLTDEQVKEAFEKAKSEILAVQPERKRGKWIIDRHGNWACDQCGNDPYHCNMENMNFCPNCGADMRGEQDE